MLKEEDLRNRILDILDTVELKQTAWELGQLPLLKEADLNSDVQRKKS